MLDTARWGRMPIMSPSKKHASGLLSSLLTDLGAPTEQGRNKGRSRRPLLNRMTPQGAVKRREGDVAALPRCTAEHGNPRDRGQADPERRAAGPEHRKWRGSPAVPFRPSSSDRQPGQVRVRGA